MRERFIWTQCCVQQRKQLSKRFALKSAAHGVCFPAGLLAI